jgi:hypothetical protein
MFELKITIDAPELSGAINALALAIAGSSKALPVAPAVQEKQEKPEAKKESKKPTEETVEKKTDFKKETIAELDKFGITAPKKWDLETLEKALVTIQENNLEHTPGDLCKACGGTGISTKGTPCGACEGSGVKPVTKDEGGTPEDLFAPDEEQEEMNLDDVTSDDAPEEEEEEEVSLDDIRTLAHAVVKSTPENPTLGKNKLGACLKKVGATNLTGATQEQLKEILPLLEKNAGKTLEEVLAEASTKPV